MLSAIRYGQYSLFRFSDKKKNPSSWENFFDPRTEKHGVLKFYAHILHLDRVFIITGSDKDHS